MADSPPPDRQLTWLPFAFAGGAVVLIIVLTFALGGGSNNRGVGDTSRVDGDGALICPGTKPQLGVPTKPHGVTTGDRLVPDSTVENLVVCDYTYEGALRGRKVVKDGYTQAQAALRAATVAVPAKGSGSASACGGPARQWLVGAVYRTGYVWVDIVDGCRLTTNGSADVDSEALATPASAAYRTGTWPS